MLIFWILYFILSFLICFSLFRLFKSKFLRFMLTIFLFGLLFGVWFIYPGSRDLAPIASIFFLENTIVESNGYMRLVRPFLAFFFSGLILGLSFILIKRKLSFLKEKNENSK